MKGKGLDQMRKAIITPESRESLSAEQQWLDLTRIARAELTSEDPSYPIESALKPSRGPGWRASGPGCQTIRLLFDEPLRIRHVHLEFHEDRQQRTQEFVLRWSPDDDSRSYREIVRQQFNFAPPDTFREVEDYAVDLVDVTSLELIIVPDVGGGEARAVLTRLLLA
jgi:hypothetical protein